MKMEKKINRIENKIVLAVLLSLFTLQLALAAGISSPYWDTPGNENPLTLTLNEKTKDIKFELQNLVGENNLTFQITLLQGQNVAQIIDEDNIYSVPIGEREDVNIRISLPANAKVGDTYKVRLSANTVEGDLKSGSFSLGTAFEKSFDVVVGEKVVPPQQNEPDKESSNSLTNIIIGVAIVVVLIIIILVVVGKRKKGNK